MGDATILRNISVKGHGGFMCVLDPEGSIIGIGSGGNFALSAAKALIDTDMSAEEIAMKSIQIAAEICVFTNNNITLEKLKS